MKSWGCWKKNTTFTRPIKVMLPQFQEERIQLNMQGSQEKNEGHAKLSNCYLTSSHNQMRYISRSTKEEANQLHRNRLESLYVEKRGDPTRVQRQRNKTHDLCRTTAAKKIPRTDCGPLYDLCRPYQSI